LGKTRATLTRSLSALTGRRAIDDHAWDSVEEALLVADVGVATTSRLLDDLRERAAAERVGDPEQLVVLLREELVEDLIGADRSLHHATDGPTVWLFVGVNGTGKTTTIAKLARRELDEGRTALLAAADTFRAAAADQLTEWAARVGGDVVRGQEGADPGSVVYDAVSAARGRGTGVVLVDTAGRMHTKVNLMEELKKIRRVAERDPGALQEVLLVIDATTGQNGLSQARQFAEAVGVTGVVLTKLDGTAKGGIVLAIEADLGIPVKLIGVGEAQEDLVPFDPEEFVAALFA
jgi:fused signal recognition particle receptor